MLLRRYQRPNGARFKAGNDAGSVNAQPECRLFMLPPEIRNIIYELVFISPSTVDFVDASSPPKALVMTCRRIHQETSEAYTDIYRSYWSKTKFMIEVFEGNPPFAPDQIPEPAEAAKGAETAEDAVFDPSPTVERSLDKDKQAKVYAKVQEMHDQDLARISNILIYSERAAEFYTLDDSASGMWRLHHRSSWNPKPFALILYAPLKKAKQLRHAGFDIGPTVGPPNTITAFIVTDCGMEDIMTARRIIARTSLSKEELMVPIRDVCHDDLE